MKIICDWENCKEIGKYKAPKEKDNSKNFRLLCLEHIKIFNKNWNYFENMKAHEIEFFIKSDLTWHKTTKSFGSSENFFNILWKNALEDKLNIFNSTNFKNFKKDQLSQTDRDAFEVMELNLSSNWTEIQKKFKLLVKKYHPDKNQGNKKYEDKLKTITLAYTQLKKKFGKK
ncbi:MAG: molecular chaperone DnaJ [Candidatus Pelagibacter sp.]|nr:molecular chaperone DnaJ [Candidatus Pelagibacter sp.]|tara:strand:+ start:501 stop:1016 length:516 start_codon:yes stop_codon:yes gene_type:complete